MFKGFLSKMSVTFRLASLLICRVLIKKKKGYSFHRSCCIVHGNAFFVFVPTTYDKPPFVSVKARTTASLSASRSAEKTSADRI